MSRIANGKLEKSNSFSAPTLAPSLNVIGNRFSTKGMVQFAGTTSVLISCSKEGKGKFDNLSRMAN